MKKKKLYLETTIPSYMTAWPSTSLIVAAHQAITINWWTANSMKYDIHISQFVIDEASSGDKDAIKRRLDFISGFKILDVTDEVLSLSKRIINSRLIPTKAFNDASHIAVAAVHSVDYLLTWNCSHINNAFIKEKLFHLCSEAGYHLPSICTPEELMEE